MKKPWLPLFFLLLGCSSLKISNSEYHHVISVDEEGSSNRLYVDGESQGRRNLDEQITGIVGEIDRVYRERLDQGKSTRLVFILHGGLVSSASAIEDARSILGEMGCQDAYPILINWETGMGSSYWDHLFWIRDGEKSGWWGPLKSPFYLLADLGRALTRLPVTYMKQLIKAGSQTIWGVPRETPPSGWQTAQLQDADVPVSLWVKTQRLATSVVPGALRIVTTFLLDAVGVSAYSNMQRRARVLFLLDEDFGAGEHKGSGAFSKLMDGLRTVQYAENEQDTSHGLRVTKQQERFDRGQKRLLTEQRSLAQIISGHRHPVEAERSDCETCVEIQTMTSDQARDREGLLNLAPLRITVIAHSMGTIVANELISRNSDFTYDEIVYMGAACSIKEFVDTTLPYIKEHPETKFYNLSLHPENELNERTAWSTLPFGSLLVWIDSYITDQKSALDRTLGSWNNIASTLGVMDYLRADIRQRILLTGFALNGPGPRAHGEFNDIEFRFWKKPFWEGKVPEQNHSSSTGGFYQCEHGGSEQPRQ